MATVREFHELARQCIRMSGTAEDGERRTLLEMADALMRVATLQADATRVAAYESAVAGPLQ